MAARRKARARTRALDFEAVRREALALPGAEEGTSYRTPAFRVGGRLFARLHQDGESLVLRMDFDAREALMKRDPRAFHITDHYLGYPMLLVRFARVSRAKLRELLAGSWREAAPKRLRDRANAARQAARPRA